MMYALYLFLYKVDFVKKVKKTFVLIFFSLHFKISENDFAKSINTKQYPKDSSVLKNL